MLKQSKPIRVGKKKNGVGFGLSNLDGFVCLVVEIFWRNIMHVVVVDDNMFPWKCSAHFPIAKNKDNKNSRAVE